jgi:hypothetical protein
MERARPVATDCCQIGRLGIFRKERRHAMIVMADDKTDTVSLIGLTWDEIWFLQAMLIRTTYESSNAEILQHADNMLTQTEAVAESICQPAEMADQQ